MNVKINDLMAKRVISAQPHHSAAHLRKLMERNRIHAIPIVGPVGEAKGIVTSTDLSRKFADGTPANKIMSDQVYTVPAYNDVSIAARIMRKHKIHHVIITHEKKVIGLLSSFDLLKLIEGHSFVTKNLSTKTKRNKRV